MGTTPILLPNEVEVINRFMPLAQALLKLLGERPVINEGELLTRIAFNNEEDAEAFLCLFLDMDGEYLAA